MKLLTAALLLAAGYTGFAGEISDYHRGKTPNNAPGSGTATSTNRGITEIGIEQTPCYGRCPIFTFIAKSDGTFRYEGERYVDRVGDFTGTVSKSDFEQLAQFIKNSGFMQLEKNYSIAITDSSTTFTMVVMDGKRKT